MDSDQIGSLIYLLLLGGAITSWVFFQNRDRLGQKLQHLTVWALLFVGVIAGYALWDDIRRVTMMSHSVREATGEITVPRALDGHYYLTLQITDEPVRFVIDTGATDMVLPLADARRTGVAVNERDFYGEARTANGIVRVAPVVLERVAIGPIVDTRLRATVNEGDMDTSLLGMRYLERFERIEIRGDQMVLAR